MPKIWENAEPVFFEKEEEFGQWLNEHHSDTDELWVGYYKTKTGIPSITWPESVDRALCYGWIDGIRKSLDDQRYMIRFTPRRPSSIWSAVNLKRIKELIAEGRIQPSGLEVYQNRSKERSERYSYEQKKARLDEAFAAKFKENVQAWSFFQTLPPSTRKPSVWWVMSAKRQSTRERRLQTLIDCSAKGEKIPPLRVGKK